MSKFRPTYQPNPCPVCGDTHGDCRENTQAYDQITYLCHTYCDSQKFDTLPGVDGQVWFCSAPMSRGTWATFHPHREQELSPEQEAAHKEKVKAQKEADEKRRLEALKNELSPAERDLHYTKMLSELSLSARDRASLRERGLSDFEIEQIGFKSVVKWQKINNRYPDNLPGYTFKFGQSQIDVGGPGIFCPVRNHEGLIVGAQIRFSEIKGKEARYRWLSRDNSAYLNGENPISCWDGATEGPQTRIWLTEGTGIKPAIANLRLKAPVLGAAGGLFGSSPQNTRAALKHLSGKYYTTELAIAVDAGDVKNPLVIHRLERQINWLEREGYRPLIAWWGQINKTDDDIDELPDLSKIKILHLTEFWKIAEQYKPAEPEAPAEISRPIPRQDRRELARAMEAVAVQPNGPERPNGWHRWLKIREYTPDLVQDSKYVTFDAPAENTILCIKSGLGSGKTHQLQALFEKGGQFEDKGSVALFARNSLIYNFTERIPSFSHLREELLILIKDPQSRLALCTNSIKKFSDPDWFRDKVLIIDETMSVALHIATSATHRKDRIESLRLFALAIEYAHSVILLDGNLTDWVVSWIASKAPNKRVVKLENRVARAKPKVEILLGTPTKSGKFNANNLSPFVAPMLSATAPIIVFSDSQRLLEQIDNMLKDAGKNGLRVDSKTVSPDSEARSFLDDCNKWIDLHKPEYILCSPTAESGVDISAKNDITLAGYFPHSYGLFRGVIGTDNQMQMMARYRCIDCTWHISVPKQSFLRNNNDVEISALNAAASKLVDLAEMDISHLRLNKGWLGEQFLALIENAKEDPDNLFALKVAQKDAFERRNLRECLIFALEESGHEVEQKSFFADGKVEAQLKLASEEVKKSTAKGIFDAEDITDEQAERLTAGWNATYADREKLMKASYKKLLPGIESTDLWSADLIQWLKYDEPQAIKAAELFYMFHNQETANKRQQNSWAKIATQQAIFLPDLHSPHLKVKALECLNLSLFLDVKKSWHKDSAELLEMCRTGSRDRIINALGFKVPVLTKGANKGKPDPIKYLRKVLEVVGIKLGHCEKKRKEGETVNTYSIDTTWLADPVRMALKEAVERRFTEFNTEWVKPEVLTVQTQQIQPQVLPESDLSPIQVPDFSQEPEADIDGVNWRGIEFAVKELVDDPEVKVGDRVKVLSQPRLDRALGILKVWVSTKAGEMVLKLSSLEMIFDTI